MSPIPRLVYEQPNVENTIPSSIYQSSSPERFSISEFDDKFIIYGGGSLYKLNLQQVYNQSNTVPAINNADVSLFVLNTNLIIWFNRELVGLEVPYKYVLLTGLTEDKLILQILNNDLISSNDHDITMIIETSTNGVRNDNPLISMNNDIFPLYEAINTCSSFYVDTDEEEEHQQVNSIQMEQQIAFPQIRDKTFNNYGYADDLDYEEGEVEEDEQHTNGEAGMDVNIGYSSIAGTKRNEIPIDTFDDNHKRYKQI